MASTDAEASAPSNSVSVFVSYAHEDSARARDVIRTLEAAGFQVWWDDLIVPGTTFAATIEQALEAAAVIVVLWSRASVGSHWVRDEASLGRDRNRLVPVSIDGTQPPLGFRQYLFIDLAGWNGSPEAPASRALLQAVAAVRDHLPAAPAASAMAAGANMMRRRLLIASGLVTALGGGGWLAWKRGLIGGAQPQANSVAVLPFTNLSGDPGQTYFADGIAAEVRSELTRNRSVRVIAQVSSIAAREAKMTAVAIARTLGVAYLLDGSVRLSGRTFRITAELSEGGSGFSRWGQSFDRSIDDIFAVQREISHAVLAALTAEIGGAAAPSAALPGAPDSPGGTTDVTAYDAYLRGRAAYNLSAGESSERKALSEFDAAIDADPKFAAAYAARSRTLILIANWYVTAARRAETIDAAVQAAETATTLAPNLADAQSTLAFALFQGRLDIKGARRPYDLSAWLGAGDATVQSRFGSYCALTGRAAEALPAMARALDLDPLNPLLHRQMGTVLLAAHRYADAIPPIERALRLNPKLNDSHGKIGNALLMLGRTREARAAYLEEMEASVRVPGLAIAARTLGDMAAARAAMDQLVADCGDDCLYQQAQVRAQWGERDAAVAALVRARALGDSGLIYSRTDPFLDPLRPLAEFAALLLKLGFD